MSGKKLPALCVMVLLLISGVVPSQGQPALLKRTLSQVSAIEPSERTPAQFSRDGSVFAYLLYDQASPTFRAVDVRRSVQIAEWTLPYFTQFAVSPDGREVATISGLRGRYGVDQGFTVEVRDLRTGAKKRTLVPTGSTHSAFYAIAWSNDGSKVAVGGGDGRVRVFELRTSKTRILTAPGFIHTLTFSPDDCSLAGASNFGGNDGSLCLWVSPAGLMNVIPVSKRSPQTLSLAFSPDGNRLLTRPYFQEVSGQTPGVVIYSVPTLTPLDSVPPSAVESMEFIADFTSQQIAVSPGGARFAFVGPISVTLSESKSGQSAKCYQFAAKVDSARSVRALSFEPDGVLHWVTSAFNGKTYRLTLWNAGKQ